MDRLGPLMHARSVISRVFRAVFFLVWALLALPVGLLLLIGVLAEWALSTPELKEW